MINPPDDTIENTRQIADSLEKRGHAGQAATLRAATTHHGTGALLLSGIRQACQIVLTTIEAIDPVCATMVEELRLEVDARLRDVGKAADHPPNPNLER